jgi:hypothetical protein
MGMSVSKREWGKGVRQVLVLHFYGARRGSGPRPGAMAMNGHGGDRLLEGIQGALD